MKKLLPFFLLIFITSFSQNYFFEKIKLRDESQYQRTYNNLFIDDNGFLWYTIQNALIQDFVSHQNIHKVKSTYKEELNYTNDIIQGKNGLIYVSFEIGLYIYNPITNESSWINKKSKDGKFIQFFDLYEDQKNNIWISTNSKKVLKYNKSGIIETFNVNDKDYKKEPSYSKINFLGDDVVLQTENKIYILNPDQKSFSKIYTDSEKTNYIITKNGEIFKKNISGTYTYKKNNYKYTFLTEIDAHIIQTPYKDEKLISIHQKLFLLNSRIHFISYKKNRIHFFSYSKKTNSLHLIYTEYIENEIHKIVLDKNSIWVSASGSIYKITFKSFPFKKILHNNNLHPKNHPNISVRGLYVDNQENIYATHSSNLLKIDSKGNVKQLIKGVSYDDDDDDIRSFWNVLSKNDSILWISGQGNKIFKYNIKTSRVNVFINPYVDTIHKKTIHKVSVHYDDEHILFGGNFGLALFNTKSKSFKRYHLTFDLKKSTVVDIILNKNEIWVATEKNGLFYYNIASKFQQNYTEDNKLNSNRIYDLHLSKNNLFIATMNGVDVVDLKSNTTKNYNIDEGFPSKKVVSIVETPNDFWFGTFKGLVRLNKRSREITTYTKENGIADDEFNQRSFFKLSDSIVYFGGVNGITKYNTKQIEEKIDSEEIFLTGLTFYDKETDRLKNRTYNLDQYKRIKIPYNDNFVSLSFATKNNADISYMVSPILKDWIPSDVEGKINLIGLNPGKHILKVKSTDDILDKNVLEYEIYVNEVFLYRKDIQIIIVIILLTLLFVFYNREKAKKARVKILEYNVKSLKEKAFRSQMNPHFIFNVINNIQSILLLKGEEQVNKYINSFAKLLRITVDESYSEETLLSKEIEYLESYLKLEQLREVVDFTFSVNVEKKLDIDAIRVPPMLFQPIIENAIKHGLRFKEGEKQLHLSFYKEKHFLVGIVKDNGIGIKNSQKRNENSSKEYKSKGNEILNQRIEIYNEIHSSKIIMSIESTHEGTSVTLKIPAF